MIVGALAGVLSVSDYRVDVDAVASVHAPESVLQDRTAWIADARHRGRHHGAKRSDTAPVSEVVACAPQSVPVPEQPETGLCVVAEDVPADPVVVAAAEPDELETPCDPAGPELPAGIAVARSFSDATDTRYLRHWPDSAHNDALAALEGLPVGPEIPDAIVVARASERLLQQQVQAEARKRELEAERLARRATAAEQEWLAQQEGLVQLAAEAMALAVEMRAGVIARAAERAAHDAAYVSAISEVPAAELAEAGETADAAEMSLEVVAEIEPPTVTADADQPALLILAGIADGSLIPAPEPAIDPNELQGPEIDSELLIARRQAEEELARIERNRLVGPEIDQAVLAARHRLSRAQSQALARAEQAARDALAQVEYAEELRLAKVADLRKRAEQGPPARSAATANAAELMGPPLPDFMAICKARFEDPFGLGDEITWADVDDVVTAEPAGTDDTDDRIMTVYVTADGVEVDYDPDADALPFDPLAATPFDGDGDTDSKTRQAFEDMLAVDEGLHTVRYIKELNHELRSGETLSQVLLATGLAAAEVDRWVRATQEVYDCNRVFAGQEIKLTVDMPDRRLKRLQLNSGRDSLIIVEASGDRVLARKQDIIYERSLRVVDARIDRSLYVSAIEERIPDRIISEMAEILGWDINFGRDLQAGSTFRVIYEQLTRVDTADTIPGRVLAVEVSNRGKLYEGFYYELGDAGDGGYYDREGESLGRSFLRFPVSYSRVSSPFSTARYHPVLKRRIPHYGVDFAAPTGTPVRAVADGQIIKSGWYGGNGRFVKIRHDSVYESGYAHLSRIASGVVANAKVRKGQVIGYVGSTGLATGPHLHFAMYQSGKYIDPMRTELPRSRSLEGRELAGFKMKVAMMDRAYAESGEGEERSTQVASAAIPSN